MKQRSRSLGKSGLITTESEVEALGEGSSGPPEDGAGHLHQLPSSASPRQTVVRRTSAARRSSVVLLQHMMQLMTDTLPQKE